MTTVDDAAASLLPAKGPFGRLYWGETKFNFVGRRWWWFLISGIIIVVGMISLAVSGLNLGIDFKGGDSWQVASPTATSAQVQTAISKAGLNDATVEFLGSGAKRQVLVEADLSKLSSARQTEVESAVTQALATLNHTSTSKVSPEQISATWGSQITHKAILAVLIFFVVVVIYISLRFEWKMAIAALIAVIHDLLVTIGVYTIFGLQVTPDTVIAVLTILGYSLYDTVVVFDRVNDNTNNNFGASGRMTYEDVVNLSMNQTLARSINTSLVAILPVLSVLLLGAEVFGATTLQYFGLALVIGLTSGAYSSIFIASPILAMLKEREPRYQNIRAKLESRKDTLGLLTPRQAALATATTTGARNPNSKVGRANAAAKRQGQVVRPGGSAKARATAKAAADAELVDVDADEELESLGDETDDDAVTPVAGGSPAKRAGTARPAGQSGARRPQSGSRPGGARPKGKGGKGKGGRRR
jgi:preprotein translocase subunit SecF